MQAGAADPNTGFTPLRALMEKLRAGGAYGNQPQPQLADPIGIFNDGTNAQGFTPGRSAFEAIRQGGGLEALQGGAANAQGFTPLRAIMERLRAGGAYG